VRDERVGGLEDPGGGAVVLLQLDDAQPGVVLREQAQVLDVGAAPAVDRLIVVAHGGEGFARPGEQFQELVLGAVGVLVFIDEEVAQPVLPALAHLGIAP